MKSKGFTLVELLAVIVVLAIISLITLPLILNFIDTAKKESFRASSYGILKSAENHYYLDTINDNVKSDLIFTYENKIETSNIVGASLDYKGFRPANGTIMILKNGQVGMAISDGTWCAQKNYDEDEIKIGKINDKCNISIPMPKIILAGEDEVDVEINTKYIDPGFTALDIDGNNITESVEVSIEKDGIKIDELDTSELSQLIIKYTLNYNDRYVEATRKINVVDTTDPFLAVPLEISMYDIDVASFNILEGIEATDNSGKIPTITFSSNLSAIYGEYVITYTATDESGNSVSVNRTVNVLLYTNPPELAPGMTPVIWDGTTEKNTTEDDPNWYDYSNKKWANAKTKDGSYWVWIPRYAYKITSGFHQNTVGTINIIFLTDNSINNATNKAIETNGYEYGVKDTSMHYFQHPAFYFDKEIKGFWVAKFEPSGTTSNVSIVPGVTSLRSLTMSQFYTTGYNMRSNSKYGWSSSTVDTHMMKNIEWGAVAYLTQSVFGKNSEVWINPSGDFITGCAGSYASASETSGCPFSYNTANGMEASTTGNITGIYDMSGGAWEYVAAYINNGNSNLTTYGSTIINSAVKYKDTYPKASTENQENNYQESKNTYGDAIYETSSSTSTLGGNSWNRDYSNMPSISLPFFARGSDRINESKAGIFAFVSTSGQSFSYDTFRPVVIIN